MPIKFKILQKNDEEIDIPVKTTQVELPEELLDVKAPPLPPPPPPKPRPLLEDDDIIFQIVEQNAEFPGGAAAMAQFIQNNLQYPSLALQNKIEGTVIVEFIVEKDGSLTNLKVLKDIGGGCGNEAMRIIKIMPKWTPDKHRDMAVRVKMRAPIKFRISR